MTFHLKRGLTPIGNDTLLYLIEDGEDDILVFPVCKVIASHNFLYCFCSRNQHLFFYRRPEIISCQRKTDILFILEKTKSFRVLLWKSLEIKSMLALKKNLMFQLYKMCLPVNIRDAVLCSVISVLCTVCTLEPVFILSEYVQAALGRKWIWCSRFHF